MEGYEPGRECAECKGKCCKDRGCSLAPEDLQRALQDGKEQAGQLREQILNLLTDAQGLYAIDYFSRPEGVCFYLRMRHKCYTFIGVDAMGECIALTKEGCGLSPEDRPKGGRYLESRADRACIQHYEKEQMCRDWEPYQETLRSIWKEYYPKMKEDGTFDRCDEAYFAWMKAERENIILSGADSCYNKLQ